MFEQSMELHVVNFVNEGFESVHEGGLSTPGTAISVLTRGYADPKLGLFVRPVVDDKLSHFNHAI